MRRPRPGLLGVLAALAALPLLPACASADGAPRTDAGPALLEAAAAGDAAAVERALAAGAPVDARDPRGRTPLLLATIGDHVDVARILVAAGADVDAQDDQRDSPFLYAGAEGRLDVLRVLLEAGPDLARTNRYGGTALIPAAHHGHVETVRELLRTGVDVDHVNRLGWTALLEAIVLGDGGPAHTEIVRLLLDGGADPGLPDDEGTTPLEHARARGYGEIERLLVAAGG